MEKLLIINPGSTSTKIAVYDGENQLFVESISHSAEEIAKIENTFINREVVDDFSVMVSVEDIKEKNYSWSAGQYFEVKIEYVELTPEEFEAKMDEYKKTLNSLFDEGKTLEDEIKKQLEVLTHVV